MTVAAQSIYTLHQALFGVGSRYAWQVGGWGPCSKSCGGGRRFKTVACRDTDTGRLVPRRHCSLVAKPPARMERCNLIRCEIFLCIDARHSLIFFQHSCQGRYQSSQFSDLTPHTNHHHTSPSHRPYLLHTIPVHPHSVAGSCTKHDTGQGQNVCQYAAFG